MQDNDPVSYLCTHRLASAIDRLDEAATGAELHREAAEILEAVALGKAGMITRSEVLAKIEKALGEALPADSELFTVEAAGQLQAGAIQLFGPASPELQAEVDAANARVAAADLGRLTFASTTARRKGR